MPRPMIFAATREGPSDHDASDQAFTPTEMMTIAAARALSNDDVAFVGIGAPSAACNVARLTHAPDITLIYESGTIGTAPDVLPLSIGDGELCETAVTTVVGSGDVPLLAAGRTHLDRVSRRRRSSTVSATSTPRSSATITIPKFACPAAAARPRSPPPASRSSSP